MKKITLTGLLWLITLVGLVSCPIPSFTQFVVLPGQSDMQPAQANAGGDTKDSMRKPMATYQIGHVSESFFDITRNRWVNTEVYYPADEGGEEVPVASGVFPVLVFGHGYLMSWQSYQTYWQTLVPLGYVMCFPVTEMSTFPDHAALADDLSFVTQVMQLSNNDPSSLFYGSLAPETAVMGHSMGGGASFLAAADNPNITALVTFAAAETDPSAIAVAADIEQPALVMAGADDCVTPPEANQLPMYQNLATDCKSYISIRQGTHCYFADYDLICQLGESSCNPNPAITRQEQQSTTFDLLKLWLEYHLLDEPLAWSAFVDSLESSSRIDYQHHCPQTGWKDNEKEMGIAVWPNPAVNQLCLHLNQEWLGGELLLMHSSGQQLYHEKAVSLPWEINAMSWPRGIYLLIYTHNGIRYTTKFLLVR